MSVLNSNAGYCIGQALTKPVSIGLSVVRLLEVRGDTLLLGGAAGQSTSKGISAFYDALDAAHDDAKNAALAAGLGEEAAVFLYREPAQVRGAQVALHRRAEVVIGVHGAGLARLGDAVRRPELFDLRLTEVRLGVRALE